MKIQTLEDRRLASVQREQQRRASLQNQTRSRESEPDPRLSEAKVKLRPLADAPGPRTDQADDPCGKGNFFAIKFDSFLAACQIGLNEAICYLILARGTGSDNRTTSWSSNSIEKYTRISRVKARACLEKMEASGIVRLIGSGKSHRVRTLFEHPPTDFVLVERPALSNQQQDLLRELPTPISGHKKAKLKALRELQSGGWVTEADGSFVIARGVKAERPVVDWIWLPNSLIDGIAGSTSPIERLRETQAVWTLALAINLYRYQELTFSQGLSHELLCRTYTRKKVGEYGQFSAYEFTEGELQVVPSSPLVTTFSHSPSKTDPFEQFWKALGEIERMGLLTFVPHIFDGPEGEVLFPLMPNRKGADCLPSEAELFEAMKQAVSSVVDSNRISPSSRGIVALVQNHIARVQMRGVPRLRHRPRTQVTSEWMAQSSTWSETARFYARLAAEFRQPSAKF